MRLLNTLPRTMNKRANLSRKLVIGLVGASLFALSACGATGGPEEGEEQHMGVDLGPGVTREQQIDEIEIVVGLLQEHLGEGLVLRAQSSDEWSREYHAEHGVPASDCSGTGQYRSRVTFYHPDIPAEDAYSAAEQLTEKLDFIPNEALNDSGAEGTGRMIFSSSSDDGRVLIVRESRKEGENVQVIYKTPCSDHESHHDALMEFVERDRKERLGEDEAQYGELDHR